MIFAPIADCAGRAIGTAMGALSSDCSGWQMSIEMLGPDRSAMMITPSDGRLAIIMTNAIATASCRIDARSSVSEIAISAACPIDVSDHRVRAHVERAVLPNLMAVGTEQECFNRVRDCSITLARSAEFELREDLVDLRGRPGQKNPAVLVRVMTLRVFCEFRGTIVLGIERDRHHRDVRSQ